MPYNIHLEAAAHQEMREELQGISEEVTKEAHDGAPFFMAAFMDKFAEKVGQEMTDLEARAFQQSFEYHLYEKTAKHPILRSSVIGAGLGGALGAGMNIHRLRKQLRAQGQDLSLSQMLTHPIKTMELLAMLGGPGAARGGVTAGGVSVLLNAMGKM